MSCCKAKATCRLGAAIIGKRQTMIKTMISHAGEDDSFVDYLYEKLDRANLGLDIFVDHKRNLAGDDAQRMIEEARKSIVFIPVLSNFAVPKGFFTNELKTAMDSKTTYIFPIRFNCDTDKIPNHIRIAFSAHDRVSGKLYLDFSNTAEWSLKSEELVKAIITKLTELDIYRKDEFFYQDVEHIDKIVSRENPSHAEIKMMVDVFLIKEAYQYYFFKRLKNLAWLRYLKIYGFFGRNPRPFEVENQTGSYSVPRWSVLDYLEWCSVQVKQGQDPKHGEALIDIIRSVSSFRDPDGKRIDNNITDWVFIKIIANLPSQFVQVKDIEMIAKFLESRWDNTLAGSEIGKNLLPALLSQGEKEKSLKLFGIVTAVKWSNRIGDFEPDSVIDAFWLNEILERNKDKLESFCPEEASEILLSRIAEIVERKPIEFSVFEIAAVEDHPQNELHKGGSPNILVRATRDLLNALVKKDLAIANGVLGELLGRKHPIFRRLALCVVGMNWETCSGLYSHFAGRQIFNDHDIKHEVYILLRNNFSSFPKEEKEKVIGWIELGPDRSDGEEYSEAQLAYWRQQWLSALIPSGYPRVIELYEKYKAITKIDPDHPDFSSYMEMGWGPDPSPIAVDILLEKNNSEIASYLITYKDTERKWKAPSREGLENALFEAVKSHPTKFDFNLKPFLSVPINYQCEIIRGFRKAWEEKRDIAWGHVLAFCRGLVSTSEFWEPSREDKERIYRDIFISGIADLITEGTKDDSRAFIPDHLPTAEDMLLTVLAKVAPGLERSDDLLFDVLNSAKGRLLTALVNYSLRVARLSAVGTTTKWAEKIKTEFTRRLDRSIEPDLKFSLTLGRYLPNLYYLDGQWVETNIGLIFPKEIEEHWQAAMEGYLLGGRVYSHIYDLMSKNSHYEKAIGTKFRNKEVRKRLLHHLCIGYLIEKESISSKLSPFRECIDQWNTEDINEMISFFWSQREYLLEKEGSGGTANQLELANKQRPRILDFWKVLYNLLRTKAGYSEGEQKVASDLVRLSCYLEGIDAETLNWLMFSAMYVEKNYNSSFFIEYLLRLSDPNPHEVGIVYVEMLNAATPVFDQNNIRNIVTKLYERGEAASANRICNIYGNRGIEFLRDIYEQHKPEKG
jgi:hypothetical protein